MPVTETKQNSILTFVYDELRPHDEFLSRTTIKRGPDRIPDSSDKTTDPNFVNDDFEMIRLQTSKTKHDHPVLENIDKIPFIEKLQAKPKDSPGKDQEVGEKEEDKFIGHKLTTAIEKELVDVNYNNFFYNDEYKEVTTKKPSESPVHYVPDEYDDKSKDKEVNSMSANDKIEGPEATDDTKKSKLEKDVIYRYNQDLETETLRRTPAKNISFNKDVSNVEAISNKSVFIPTEPRTQTPKDVIKIEKRRQKCSMLKLRQLNFNSPRTLPEVIFQVIIF